MQLPLVFSLASEMKAAGASGKQLQRSPAIRSPAHWARGTVSALWQGRWPVAAFPVRQSKTLEQREPALRLQPRDAPRPVPGPSTSQARKRVAGDALLKDAFEIALRVRRLRREGPKPPSHPPSRLRERPLVIGRIDPDDDREEQAWRDYENDVRYGAKEEPPVGGRRRRKRGGKQRRLAVGSVSGRQQHSTATYGSLEEVEAGPMG